MRNYPRYFLGTIITVTENGQRNIVDGQQRLTTLSLLLIYIHHLRKENNAISDVSRLIFSESYGDKSFNIDVFERRDCMRALFEVGQFDATDHSDLSVRNLAERYEDIYELFPDSLKKDVLPYFVDWLIENVDLVEIEAYTDDDAFTIFETMNDRGVNLSQVDMLKGYLLANINDADEKVVQQKKEAANKVWKSQIVKLFDLGSEDRVDENFFKTWLRAKYAETIREKKKGAVNRDFEEIDKFHRWVRDNKTRVGLNATQDFYAFITRRFQHFAGHYIRMRKASYRLTPGCEEIRYNAYNNFTLQYMLALAPLKLEDDHDTINEKIRLVTTFIDIYLARRKVNFKLTGYNTVHYTMFNLAKAIRDMDVDALRAHLLDYLSKMQETFDGIKNFRLHGRNSSYMYFLLVRMTVYIEQGSGINTNFDAYMANNSRRPCEIEHIWADKYERHRDEFASEGDFHWRRNYLGGLVLVRRGTNQSLGAAAYESKVKHYVNENLLAASLTSQTYEKNPNFAGFMRRSGLPFRAHESFKLDDLKARQDLYRRICEQVWDPARLESAR